MRKLVKRISMITPKGNIILSIHVYDRAKKGLLPFYVFSVTGAGELIHYEHETKAYAMERMLDHVVEFSRIFKVSKITKRNGSGL